jgi:integrase
MDTLCRQMDVLMGAPVGRDEAVEFRDCLLVATATLTGLRRRNLLDMQLDRNLIRVGPSWRLDFGETETKTGRAIAMAWPKPLLGYLSHYLDEVRPRLLGATAEPSRFVFITHARAQIARPTIAAIFTRVSIRLYGVRLHPHAVRYTEVTTMLWHDPNSLDIAAAALGHHGTRTTDQFYDQGTTRSAQRVWLDLVKKMKQG